MGDKMQIKELILDYIIKKFEKVFLRNLHNRLLKDNISEPNFILEEIMQKTPLIFESFLKSKTTENYTEKTHIKISSFILSVFSSLRLHYKDVDIIYDLINEISPNIFYKEIVFFIKIAFLFSKNKIIALWNYFILFQQSFINLLFGNFVKFEKDYYDKKITMKITPFTYMEFFQKHKIENLIFPAISYLEAISKAINTKFNQLEIGIEKDKTSYSLVFYLFYK